MNIEGSVVEATYIDFGIALPCIKQIHEGELS
jgi:hypothetical protein